MTKHRFIEILRTFFKERAYSIYDSETLEKEKLFSFLLYGWMIGFPLPVTFLSLDTLPYAEKELKKLFLIIRDMDDVFGSTLGKFDID